MLFFHFIPFFSTSLTLNPSHLSVSLFFCFSPPYFSLSPHLSLPVSLVGAHSWIMNYRPHYAKPCFSSVCVCPRLFVALLCNCSPAVIVCLSPHFVIILCMRYVQKDGCVTVVTGCVTVQVCVSEMRQTHCSECD